MGSFTPVFPVPGKQKAFIQNRETNDTIRLRLVLSWQEADTEHELDLLALGPYILQCPGCLDRQMGTPYLWRTFTLQTGIMALEERHCGQ